MAVLRPAGSPRAEPGVCGEAAGFLPTEKDLGSTGRVLRERRELSPQTDGTPSRGPWVPRGVPSSTPGGCANADLLCRQSISQGSVFVALRSRGRPITYILDRPWVSGSDFLM